MITCDPSLPEVAPEGLAGFPEPPPTVPDPASPEPDPPDEEVLKLFCRGLMTVKYTGRTTARTTTARTARPTAPKTIRRRLAPEPVGSR